MENLVREFVEKRKVVSFEDGDIAFLDSFDHLVTNLIQQSRDDYQFGIPFNLGPVSDRWVGKGSSPNNNLTVAHPTLVNYPSEREARSLYDVAEL